MKMSIETLVEAKRGCGYRAPGGLYLVADGIPFACGRLPIPLKKCPTCGGGIEFRRGWQWINPTELFGESTCGYDVCGPCYLSEGTAAPRMGLLWVGESHYPTPDDFAQEAASMGASKRISGVPEDFKPGETVVLLVHRFAVERECETCGGYGGFTFRDLTEREECTNCNATGFAKYPGVFYAMRPTRVEYVVAGNETERELESKEKRGIRLVKVVPDYMQYGVK